MLADRRPIWQIEQNQGNPVYSRFVAEVGDKIRLALAYGTDERVLKDERVLDALAILSDPEVRKKIVESATPNEGKHITLGKPEGWSIKGTAIKDKADNITFFLDPSYN